MRGRMSWMCVGCSERHLDGTGAMGFGLCKVCHEKMRIRNAEKRAAMIAAKREKRFKKAY